MKKRTFLLVALFLSAVLLYFSPPKLPFPSIYNFVQFNPDNKIRLFTSFDTYNINDKNITLFTINDAFFKDQYFPVYNTAWRAEVKINGLWCNIPFKKGFVFDDDFYGRYWRKRYQYIDLNDLDYNIVEGNYRIIKNIGLRPYTVEFNISKEVPSIQSYYNAALDKLPYFITTDELIKSGAVLCDYKQIYNIKTLHRFLLNVATGNNDTIRTAGYTYEGDLILRDIKYSSESGMDKFTYSYDNKRDAYGSGSEDDKIYSFLVTDGKCVYLSNNSSYVYNLDGYNDIILFIPKNSEWEGWQFIKSIAENKRIHNEDITYRKWFATQRRNISITNNPLEFIYTDLDNNITNKHMLGNKLSTAVSIREIAWLDKNTALFICDTDSDLTYYEIYNVNEQNIEAYTTSTSHYNIDNGSINIGSFYYKK